MLASLDEKMLYAVAGFLLGLGIGALALNSVHGENYIYNMTNHDLIESRILDACIELKITSPECMMIYGGIYTGNGEAIK